MKPGPPAVQLYACTDPAYPDCARPAGSRCVNAKGKEVPPHPKRWNLGQGYADAWNKRQAELDELTGKWVNAEGDLADAKHALDEAALVLAGLRRDVATRDVRISQLEAEVEELRNPPPPPVRTKFGMNLSPGTSFTSLADESAADQAKRLVATYGTLPVAKVFYRGALPAKFNPTYEGLVPGKRAYVCFKSFTLAALKSYCASIPDGWDIVLIYFQEPDDEIWVDNSLTIADFTAKTKQVVDTVKASGRARSGSCFMEYSLTQGRWSDAVVVPGIDVLVWDCYFNSSAPNDPLPRIKAMRAVATRLGIANWAVGEMGDRPTTFKDGAVRASFWAKVCDGLAAEDAEAAIYFNAIGTTGDHRLRPGIAYSDPTVAVFAARMTVRELT